MNTHAPLPERLRPGDFALFVGQDHLRVKIENLLRAKRLPSVLLFGPPGCGKSTLALLLAKAHGTKIMRISAPEAGLTQLRRTLADTDILVLDELHRFSKAQQDFFLPLLESGELILLATTTENPSFSVTPQLLSRLHVLRLQKLTQTDLVELCRRGIADQELHLPDDVLAMLASLANGDARVALNLIEYMATLPPEKHTCENLRNILPELAMRHDKNGDSHYELASALIKSIRGSDPDASLYYLACLLEGGEDPLFICRRLILSASEDVGLADPHALPLAVACQHAVAFVGMPEGFIPLAETVVYLALARKSNTTYAAYGNALHEIKTQGAQPVPLHLRNAVTRLQKQWEYGKNYQYPHNFPDAWVEQRYLPENVVGKRFYYPKENGEENRLAIWWKRILASRGSSK